MTKIVVYNYIRGATPAFLHLWGELLSRLFLLVSYTPPITLMIIISSACTGQFWSHVSVFWRGVSVFLCIGGKDRGVFVVWGNVSGVGHVCVAMCTYSEPAATMQYS